MLSEEEFLAVVVVEKNEKNILPASGRPQAGRLRDTHRPGSWAGRWDFGSEVHIVRSGLGPHFDQSLSFLQGFIRVWLQKRGHFGSP